MGFLLFVFWAVAVVVVGMVAPRRQRSGANWVFVVLLLSILLGTFGAINHTVLMLAWLTPIIALVFLLALAVKQRPQAATFANYENQSK